MINVLISSDSRYEVDKNFLVQVARSWLEGKRLKGKIEISISIVGDRAIRGLNRKYLNRDKTTDVLSFPQEDTTPSRFVKEQTKSAGFVRLPDKVLRLGDIIISYPQALAQAVETGTPIEEELQVLVEHGINHLLGIHHE